MLAVEASAWAEVESTSATSTTLDLGEVWAESAPHGQSRVGEHFDPGPARRPLLAETVHPPSHFPSL